MSRNVMLPSLLMVLLTTLWILPHHSSDAATPSVSKTKNLAQCTSDSDCDSSKTFLRCSNKQCQCLYVNYFDEEMNRCLIRVGASCEVKGKSQYCVAFADCKPNSSGGKEGTCHCRPKYKETIAGLCSGSSGSGGGLSYNLFLLLLCLILPATKVWY